MRDHTLYILGLTALNPSYLRENERRLLQDARQVFVPAGSVAAALAEGGVDAPMTVLNMDRLDWSEGPSVYCSPGAPIPMDTAAAALQQKAAAEDVQIQVIQGPPVSSSLGRKLPGGTRAGARAVGPGSLDGLICTDDDLWVESLWSAADVAKTASILGRQYPASHRLTVVSPGTLSPRWRGAEPCNHPVRFLTVGDFVQDFSPGEMDLLYVPALPLEDSVRKQLVESGQAMAGLLGVIHRLRGPGGCPWDRGQTHSSLRPFLLEECHELMDALADGRPGRIRDELGDVLLQVLLHSVIGHESGDFDAGDVMAGLSDKMIRRHPHVFAGAQADTAADVEASWERIKREQRENEEAEHRSALDSIPAALPALLQAEKVQSVVSRVGFDWKEIEGPVAKVREEVEEFAGALCSSERGSELGDLLFSLVNLSRFLSLSAETELLGTIAKFRRRFGAIERWARREGMEIEDMTLEQMDQIWEQHKARE